MSAGRWALVAVLALTVLWIPQAHAAEPEQITRFDSTVRVGGDGTVHVRETITYDFGSARRHGLRRDIPHLSMGLLRNRTYEIANVRAQEGGAPQPVRTGRSRGNAEIRVGDPHRRVTGVRTYLLEYELRGLPAPHPSHDELRWNFVGGDWDVLVRDITVRLIAPGVIGADCGSGQCSRTGDTVTLRTDDPENAELTVRLRKGAVAEPSLRHGPYAWEQFPHAVGLSAAGILLAAGVLVLTGVRHAADRTWPVRSRNAPGVPPGLAGVVWDGRLTEHHVAATVLDLADRGLLRVTQSGDESRSREWTLTATGEPGRDLHPYENVLFSAVAEEGPVTLAGLRDGGTLARLRRELITEARRDLLRTRPHPAELTLTVLLWTAMIACWLGLIALVVLAATAPYLAWLLLAAGGLLCMLALLPDKALRPARTRRGRRLRRHLAGHRRHLRAAGPRHAPLQYGLVLRGRRDRELKGRPPAGFSHTAGAETFVRDLLGGAALSGASGSFGGHPAHYHGGGSVSGDSGGGGGGGW